MSGSRPWLKLLQELYAPPSPEEARRQNDAYGTLLVDLGLATRKQIEQCLAAPAESGRPFPNLSRLLIEQGILSAGQLAGSVVARAAEDPDNCIRSFILVGKLRGETWKTWDRSRKDWAELTYITVEDAGLLRERAKVVHPALPMVLEIGVADGRDYVVFEAVPGMTLATAPRGEPRRLIEAVRDAAEGVAALHEKKLIHGGISPETVLLADRGRIAGWGRAKDDVRALAGSLYEVLSDRPAPPRGVPKTWPKRLGKDLRGLFEKAFGSRRFSAKALAEGLTSLLKSS